MYKRVIASRASAASTFSFIADFTKAYFTPSPEVIIRPPALSNAPRGIARSNPLIYMLSHTSLEVHAGSQCEVEGPCFLAAITSIHTGRQNRISLIRCAHELQIYLEAAKDVTIDGLQMLCPPTVTGKKTWSLECLLQITFFRGVETSESAIVYKTSDGLYKIGRLDLRRKKTKRVWCAAQSLKSLAPQSSNPIWDMGVPFLYGNVR